MKTYNAESGRSMIEMLGVLAIIGVLSVGGIAGYSKAMHKYRMNKTIEQITLIAGNVRTFFKGDYKDLNSNNKITILLKAKVFPDEMLEYNDDGTFKQFTNVFGGFSNLSSAHRASNDDARAFAISYKIPSNSEEICIDLLSHNWTDANVTLVQMNAPTIKWQKIPADLSEIVANCSSWAAMERYSISLIFYVDVDNNCRSGVSFDAGNKCL